jgi:hypothetical protein
MASRYGGVWMQPIFAETIDPPTIIRRTVNATTGGNDMGKSGLRIIGYGGGLLCLILIAGCTDAREPISVHSHDPDRQILAIKQDVACNNTVDIPQLVDDLSSDDPAIRFYAIQGLHRLTHDDFGYCYYLEVDRQQSAISKWKQWLQRQK